MPTYLLSENKSTNMQIVLQCYYAFEKKKIQNAKNVISSQFHLNMKKKNNNATKLVVFVYTQYCSVKNL